MKRCSVFPKAPALLEPHCQNVYYHIQDTRWGGGGLTSLQRSSQHILQPQPTEQARTDLRIRNDFIHIFFHYFVMTFSNGEENKDFKAYRIMCPLCITFDNQNCLNFSKFCMSEYLNLKLIE